MRILKIDHLGIAVPNLAEALKAWEGLGFSSEAAQAVPTEGVRVAFEPTDPRSPIARFLEKRAGMHHVCVLVDDLDAALAELKARNVRLIDENPRPGAGGSRVAFLHPQAAGGVLLELKQAPAGATS